MRRVVCLVLFFLSVGFAEAQQRELTIEAIYGGELSSPSPSQIEWTPDGDLTYFLSGNGGRALWHFDTETGERTVLVTADVLQELAPSPWQATDDSRERTRRTRFAVPDYHWSPDGESILFTSSGRVILYDVETKGVSHLASSKENVLDPKFSPDGSTIAFVYDHDIWVVPTDGGDERQLTFGGSDEILHGDLDWVYPEELRVRTGYHWSPNSRHIAYLELDETLVPTYPITDLVGRPATVDLQRYPKPGDPNPRVRVGIVDVETARTEWIDRSDEYIPRIDWKDGESAFVQLLNRAQERLEIVRADPETGRSKSLRVDTDPHWINVPTVLTFLDDGRFVWTSERTGFRHVYLHDENGKILRALTEGEWQVDDVVGVDSKQGLVYFTANRDNPIGQDLYRVRLDGSGMEKLTDGRGAHRITMSPGATAYLDRYSSMLDPGRTTFHDIASGRTLTFHEQAPLDDYELVTPEWSLLSAPDGAKIGLLLMKPAVLEAGRKYPLVAYVYGMPGFGTIRDAWGGTRFLFHQLLVQQGYVVAYIDDRTAAVWGHRYATLGDHDIGPLAVKDHAVAVEHLTGLAYVDGERTAVWGWSGGGFTATFHMTHTDLFKVGVAGAPVTDWRLYDSIYTERYLGVPHEDPEAYQRTSSIEAAGSYRGRMLLVHGTQDDNVHPQNTIQLVDALIRNRKQFDLMLYPNETHSVGGTNELIHLWTMVFEYLERHLEE